MSLKIDEIPFKLTHFYFLKHTEDLITRKYYHRFTKIPSDSPLHRHLVKIVSIKTHFTKAYKKETPEERKKRNDEGKKLSFETVIEGSYGSIEYNGHLIETVAVVHDKDSFNRKDGQGWVRKHLKEAMNIIEGQKHTETKIPIPSYIRITNL